jgi:hypothetical protein
VAGAGQRHITACVFINDNHDYGVWLERRHHLAPNAQPLTFCPATFRRVKGLWPSVPPSFVVLMRRARA